ncbi:MAG TPA: NADP-dependent malic enzyme [Sporichthyaceae bacterium]|jgi:malate dehydrogenase (oxaloacetate-decarboxylating)|nr:NADP-dependent malic enzyme [Sporichthyaceae bacterium]
MDPSVVQDPPQDTRPDIAYTLDVVIADRYRAAVARAIAAAAPGSVLIRRCDQPVAGPVSMRMVTDGEPTHRWLQHWLRADLGTGLLSCTDPAIDRSRTGKIRIRAAVPLQDSEDLAFAYTPGVGRVASMIAADPGCARQLTGRHNRVAVVTDGSAVLGLGNLGPTAALPVMEGKAALFAHLAGIDAVPICLDTHDVDGIVAAVSAIAPGFGGVNLEDIAAPTCFAVETRLRETLDIPVLHDDQHGTAVVVLAALLNALTVVGKQFRNARIVVLGAGAAGTAVTRLLLAAGATDVIVWAPPGVLHPRISRQLPAHKQELAAMTNPRGIHGGLPEALRNADAVIGLSAARVLNRSLIEGMAKDPIVFAMANPVPEIHPAEICDLAAVTATGRSDHPNQVNNALVFPGLFRGALDADLTAFTLPVLLACAGALADLVTNPTTDRILPELLDPRVVPAVAATVRASAAAADPTRSA